MHGCGEECRRCVCEARIRTGLIDLALRSAPLSSRMSAALLTRRERPPAKCNARRGVRRVCGKGVVTKACVPSLRHTWQETPGSAAPMASAHICRSWCGLMPTRQPRCTTPRFSHPTKTGSMMGLRTRLGSETSEAGWVAGGRDTPSGEAASQAACTLRSSLSRTSSYLARQTS